jgi:hypothetical protein
VHSALVVLAKVEIHSCYDKKKNTYTVGYNDWLAKRVTIKGEIGDREWGEPAAVHNILTFSRQNKGCLRDKTLNLGSGLSTGKMIKHINQCSYEKFCF